MKVIIEKSYDLNNNVCNCDGSDCTCNDKSSSECTCLEYVPPNECRVGS